MDFRKDIEAISKTIIDRDLTEKEIDDIETEMNNMYNSYLCIYKDADVKALFDEDFYDNLKEIIDILGLHDEVSVK